MICKNCKQQFEVTDEDTKFYSKIGSAKPTFCPQCRQQRRLAFRNELNLYQRKCDHSGKTIISMYSPDKKYKVYDQKIWWSDKWDAMDYGRDFDFGKPFFEQFLELQKVVPRMSLNCIGNENSEFTNYSFRNKNTYLIFTADFNEDSYYGRFGCNNFKCVDWDFTDKSTFCYETADIFECNKCFFSQKCENSSELYFCYDMKNCHNCIFSANLRNKRNYIFNKQVTLEEFQKAKGALPLWSHKGLMETMKESDKFLSKQPRKYLEMLQCEDSLGDHLRNSKNAKYCFDSQKLHDVKYVSQLGGGAKDCYDWDFFGADSELCYEMVSCAYQIQNCKFTMNTWDGNYGLSYCDLCLGNKDLFGCVALRKKRFCILNKQYSEEEYEKLVPKIIEHMKRTGEWGEFMPAQMSPFCYNESVAYEYFPMTREEALQKGYKWKERDEKEYAPQNYQIPDNIKDVPETIINEILACTQCGKNYRIIPQELVLYRDNGVAIPRKCYNCRHKRRMALRNPRKFYDRTCYRCGTNIKTTYPKSNPAPIYCEKCYEEAVYE